MIKKHLHPKAEIIYQKGEVYVFEKPTGVLTHPNTPADQKEALINAPYQYDQEAFVLSEGKHLYLVHRLDKETSGLVLATTNPHHSEKLKQQFKDKKIQKKYVSLVFGKQTQSVTWKDHLNKKGSKTFIEKKKVPNAVTEVKPLRFIEPLGVSLLELFPQTGKTHQLRIQSSSRSLPIAGDRLYGSFDKNKFFAEKTNIKNMCLHAAEITFFHPSLNETIKLTSEAPFVSEVSTLFS